MNEAWKSRPEAQSGAAPGGISITDHNFTPVLAVVVRRQLASGGCRTSIYRTLAPAEKAVARAARAGLAAVVQFVQLVPVDGVPPAALAELEGGECE